MVTATSSLCFYVSRLSKLKLALHRRCKCNRWIPQTDELKIDLEALDTSRKRKASIPVSAILHLKILGFLETMARESGTQLPASGVLLLSKISKSFDSVARLLRKVRSIEGWSFSGCLCLPNWEDRVKLVAASFAVTGMQHC
ncbi:hypothetical protein E2542_SST01462 [Spatholobus suberectus]|nr:hypothetical protein E2542_SST01462 [Spatholobus suberectus]